MAQVQIDWKYVITTSVAVLVGGVGWYKFYIEQKNRKPTATVTLSAGFLNLGVNTSEAMFIITVANSGEKPINLSSWMLILPHNKQIIYPSANGNYALPHELLPAKSCTLWVPMKLLAQSLKESGYRNKLKLKARFSDQVGNQYISEPYNFDIEDWSK